MHNTTAIDEALECFRGKYPISKREGRAAGATDTGDLSSIMPVIRFKAGGYKGAFHSPAVEVVDEYLTYVVPAMLYALTAYNLLHDGAQLAKDIRDTYTPVFQTLDEYLKQKESMQRVETIAPDFMPGLH